MNDELESRLQSLRYRELPFAWKAELLNAALPHAPSFLKTMTPPRWLAWGLAAVWALVLTLSATSRDAPSNIATRPFAPKEVLQQRQELLATLLSVPIPATP